MVETFIALLFAHTLADFVFQTNWMVANKRNPLALGLHVATVYASAVAATGLVHPALLALALIHIGIDVGKLILSSVWKTSGGLAPFLIDQALHLVSLVALTLWLPDLWANGFWAPGAIATGEDGGILGTGLWSAETALPVSQLPALMVLLTGLILATRAGGFAVGLLMEPFSPHLGKGDAGRSLPGAGNLIGLLERGLTYVLVTIGLPMGVAFLIAAKSVLRFHTIGGDRRVSEYVIIGTMASIGWALLTAVAVLALGAAVRP